MHLGLWLSEKMSSDSSIESPVLSLDSAKPDMSKRRTMMMGAGLAGAAFLPQIGCTQDGNGNWHGQPGFGGKGHMNFDTGQDWIKAFYESNEKVVTYYADDFVFEDTTLFQNITSKEELTTAFMPFQNKDPKSPIGLHYFDVVRYDGGIANNTKATIRKERPEWYTEEEYSIVDEIFQGSELEYDEWGVMTWVWKGVHNVDFLGLPAAGKSTMTRGTTFHLYKNRKIVREFTSWDFRRIAVELGAAEPPFKFWKKA